MPFTFLTYTLPISDSRIELARGVLQKSKLVGGAI